MKSIQKITTEGSIEFVYKIWIIYSTTQAYKWMNELNETNKVKSESTNRIIHLKSRQLSQLKQIVILQTWHGSQVTWSTGSAVLVGAW